jgi:hypothetical protein
MKILILYLVNLYRKCRFFYALSIERARYKQSLFPGSLNLTLSSSNIPGSSQQLYLTDNSGMVTLPTYYGTMRAYQVN